MASGETTPRTSALTVAELARVNEVSRFKAERVADRIEAALRLSADGDKQARLNARMCRGCFYAGSRCAGQGFTGWTCSLCPHEGMNSNTAAPKVCDWCSTTYGLCVECGGDLDMKRRTKFERKARQRSRVEAANGKR